MRQIMKNAREKKGLTHEDVARIIGVSRATYTNIENGNKNPSLVIAISIKNVLDYHNDDIFLDYECLNGTSKSMAS
jgi:putative transcriptional regulator